jgi:CRP-like cAMP-binding protein
MPLRLQLLNYLQKFVPSLTEEEFSEYILPNVQTRKFGKNEIISKEGEVENYYYYIVKGLARKYYIKGKEEINTQIASEGQIIHSQESFYSRTPSEYTVQTIEPCIMFSLTYEAQEATFLKHPKLERLGRIAITTLFVVKDKWQMQMIKLNSKERFLAFVTKNQHLLQRVPQKHLASLLNIKPETFSRFKHLLKERPRKILVDNTHLTN